MELRSSISFLLFIKHVTYIVCNVEVRNMYINVLSITVHPVLWVPFPGETKTGGQYSG